MSQKEALGYYFASFWSFERIGLAETCEGSKPRRFFTLMKDAIMSLEDAIEKAKDAIARPRDAIAFLQLSLPNSP